MLSPSTAISYAADLKTETPFHLVSLNFAQYKGQKGGMDSRYIHACRSVRSLQQRSVLDLVSWIAAVIEVRCVLVFRA